MTQRVWTIKDALDWTVDYLSQKGIDQPRISAEWLISSATGLSRVEVYAYHERPLSEGERATLRESVKRRAQGMPLQYVTGEMPFRHIIVHVEPGVFIPRPETETLVQIGLDHLARIGESEPLAADLCTGSGCVACALASEHEAVTVFATDTSRKAVEVCAANIERLGVSERVCVEEGDLFTPFSRNLHGRFHVVLANPPYIPSSDLTELPAEVAEHEPDLALDGGQDGLDVARRIAEEATVWLAPGGLLAIELDESRVQDAVKDLEAWYEDTYVAKDLAGRDRVAVGTLP